MANPMILTICLTVVLSLVAERTGAIAPLPGAPKGTIALGTLPPPPPPPPTPMPSAIGVGVPAGLSPAGPFPAPPPPPPTPVPGSIMPVTPAPPISLPVGTMIGVLPVIPTPAPTPPASLMPVTSAPPISASGMTAVINFPPLTTATTAAPVTTPVPTTATPEPTTATPIPTTATPAPTPIPLTPAPFSPLTPVPLPPMSPIPVSPGGGKGPTTPAPMASMPTLGTPTPAPPTTAVSPVTTVPAPTTPAPFSPLTPAPPPSMPSIPVIPVPGGGSKTGPTTAAPLASMPTLGTPTPAPPTTAASPTTGVPVLTPKVATPPPTAGSPTTAAVPAPPGGPAPAGPVPNPTSATPSGPTPGGPSPAGPSPAGPAPAGPSPGGPSPAGPTPAGPTPGGPSSPTGGSPSGPAAPGGPSAGGPSPVGAPPAGAPSPAGPSTGGSSPSVGGGGPSPAGPAPALGPSSPAGAPSPAGPSPPGAPSPGGPSSGGSSPAGSPSGGAGTPGGPTPAGPSPVGVSPVGGNPGSPLSGGLSGGSACTTHSECASQACQAGHCCSRNDGNCTACDTNGLCTSCRTGFLLNAITRQCTFLAPILAIAMAPKPIVKEESQASFAVQVTLAVSNGAQIPASNIEFDVTSAVPAKVTVSDELNCNVTGLVGLCAFSAPTTVRRQSATVATVDIDVAVPQYFRGSLTLIAKGTSLRAIAPAYASVVVNFALSSSTVSSGSNALTPAPLGSLPGANVSAAGAPADGNTASATRPPRNQVVAKSIFTNDEEDSGIHFVIWTTLAYLILVVLGKIVACARSGAALVMNENSPAWKFVAHHHLWISAFFPCHRHCVTVHATQLYLGVLASYMVTLLVMDLSAAWATPSRLALMIIASALFMAVPRALLSYHFWAFAMPKYEQQPPLHRIKSMAAEELQNEKRPPAVLKTLAILDEIDFDDSPEETVDDVEDAAAGENAASDEMISDGCLSQQHVDLEDDVVVLKDNESASKNTLETAVVTVAAAPETANGAESGSPAATNDANLIIADAEVHSSEEAEEVCYFEEAEAEVSVSVDGSSACPIDAPELMEITAKKFRRIGYGFALAMAVLLCFLDIYLSAGWTPADRSLFWKGQLITFITSFAAFEFVVLMMTLAFRYVAAGQTQENHFFDQIRMWHPYDGELRPAVA